MDNIAPDSFVKDIWYFAGLLSDLKNGTTQAMSIAGEPIVLAREGDAVFALRDICPHRLDLRTVSAKRYPPCPQTPR